MAELKVDIAAEFVGKKAFNDAVKQTLGLNAQVKNLAKSYVGLFTVQRLGRGAFNAAKAFAADDKAARVLTQSLDNLGLAFADPSVRNFIADLEKQFGVLDDQLRPAYQRLLTTTLDLGKSQKLLRTALDLSAASGADVVTVAGDLSKAYVGQTRSLAKYGLGLTQAQLKAMDFEQVQSKINDLFGGQAITAVNSYSGAFAKLAVSANNAKEAIGRGLLDSFAALGGGGSGGMTNTLNLIEKTSTALETFIRRFGVGAGIGVQLLKGNLSGARAIGIAEQNRGKDTSGITPAIRAELLKAAASKAIAKNSVSALKSTKEQTKAIKEQTALQKAGTLFDIQQTQIIAALKGDISSEERKRLELQLAILTGNTSEASKLAYELAKSQGLSQSLASYLANLPDAKNPFSGWKSYLDMLEAQVSRIAGVQPGMPATNGGSVAGNPNGNYPLVPGGNFKYDPPIVNVMVSLDGQEMAGAITKVQTNNYLSGKILALERLNPNFG